MEVVFRGKTTNAEVRERKRKEKQDELGVCRIRRTERDQRSQTLGSGFLVKDLEIIPGFRCPYCLISSDRVFPKDDCNIESYYLDFRKLESTDLKTIKLVDVAAKSTDITRTSGLVVIPIKPSKKCDKNQSIFTYRPFKVASVGITPDEDLVCHFVDDGPGPTNFSVKGLALKRSETVPTQFQLHEALDRPYTTYDEVTRKGDRKPYGAVILKPSNNEFMAGGALTFTDNECRNISSVFFPLPLVTQTSQPFSDGNEYPVSEQQVSVDNAPSVEVESPGVASAETSESVPDGNEYHVSEQQPPANNATSTDGVATNTAALKLRIDVETMIPAEHYTQERTPVSTVESGGSRNVGHQGTSAVPVSSGQTQHSCTGAEAHQAPNLIHTKEEVLCLIATNYLQARPLRCKDDCDDFLAYMEKMRLIITGVSVGSLLITVKCDSLQILERLWEDYLSGHLGEVVQRCFVTEEILAKLSLAELKLKTTISEEEYKACKMYLGKNPAKEADETDDDNDSASDDEDQCGSVAVPVEQPTHFSDEENLAQRDQEDDSRTEKDECENVAVPVPVEKPTYLTRARFLKERDHISSDSGISSATSSSYSSLGLSRSSREDPPTGSGKVKVHETGISSATSSSYANAELNRSTREVRRSGRRSFRIRSWRDRVHQIAKAGLEMFDVSSPKELQDYVTYLTHEMDSAELPRPRGSVADKPLSTGEHYASKEGSLTSITPEKQPYSEEVKTLQEGGTTGDKHTASSTSSELQGDVKWARSVVMETSKPVRESHSVKYLTEAMDDEELRKFVSIHIKEGKWQVVMLFLDELLHRDRRDTDEDTEGGDLKSRTLTWWPADEDQDLVTLCKVLTESDCKLDSLDLSYKHAVTSEGVKHIAEALSNGNCQLKSLNLGHNYLITDKGVKHIAEALSNSDCQLNSLNLTCSNVTGEGVKHVAEALSNSNCQLNSLDLSWNKVTDEGVKHIAEALSNSNCQLNSLNLSNSDVTDKGVKHIAEALSNSNCQLNSLNLSRSKVTGEGVKDIAEALSNSNCQLNSLNLSYNVRITDKRVKHIADALSNSNCQLNSLNLTCSNITDEGVKHIAEALSNSNCQLNSLNLSNNVRITDKGVKHIADALSNSNCQLNSLNLTCSNITGEGVKHVAEALSNSNCHLNSLDLSWNKVTDEGVKNIAEALSNSNCQLNSLNLRDSDVTDEGVKHIAEALSSSNCQLNSLDLSYNSLITDEGVKDIAETLSNSNCQLNSLNLSDSDITDEGAKHIAEALSNSDCQLNSLNLSNNVRMTDKWLKHLAESLKHSNYTKKL